MGTWATHAHTCLLCGFFHSREKAPLGMIWPRPLLATCLRFAWCLAWCVLPSDPRPTWVFNPWTEHWFFSMFFKNLSLLASPSSGAEQPEFCFAVPQVTNGNLLSPAIKALGTGVLCQWRPLLRGTEVWWPGLAQEPVLLPPWTLSPDSGAGFWLSLPSLRSSSPRQLRNHKRSKKLSLCL